MPDLTTVAFSEKPVSQPLVEVAVVLSNLRMLESAALGTRDSTTEDFLGEAVEPTSG